MRFKRRMDNTLALKSFNAWMFNVREMIANRALMWKVLSGVENMVYVPAWRKWTLFVEEAQIAEEEAAAQSQAERAAPHPIAVAYEVAASAAVWEMHALAAGAEAPDAPAAAAAASAASASAASGKACGARVGRACGWST